MKFRVKKEPLQDQIDMSPLIDMVFILLIFFMVTTTFVKDMQVDLNRPGASSATMSSDKSIRVMLDASKKIYFDGQEVELWALQGLVRSALAENAAKDVLIITDTSVSAQNLIDVVDQVRLSGAQHVGVATEQEG
ncbi:MAG: ExbD/TolR family protein [Bdellovibrionales bacterium]